MNEARNARLEPDRAHVRLLKDFSPRELRGVADHLSRLSLEPSSTTRSQ